MFDTSFTACAFFFFFKVEISSQALLLLFRPGSVRSDSASWDDCGRMYPDKLFVSSFLDRFPHYACTAAQSTHCNFIRSRVYVCLGVTCHLHFLQNDRGLLHATAVTRGRNGHQIKISTQSYLWRRKFFHCCCHGIWTRNLSTMSLVVLPTSSPGSPIVAVMSNVCIPIIYHINMLSHFVVIFIWPFLPPLDALQLPLTAEEYIRRCKEKFEDLFPSVPLLPGESPQDNTCLCLWISVLCA